MTNRTYKSGPDRAQLSFLPLCPEDYVGSDNPVRAIEAYVGSLDLAALGFRYAQARPLKGSGAGQRLMTRPIC